MRSPRIDCRATSAASIPVRGRRTSATASGCALDARNADATSTKSTSQNEFLSRLKQTSATADREERFVHVVAAVVADEQPFELVQPREGPLDDPAVAAQAGAVRGLATADRWSDPAPAQLAPVLVVVVTAVGAETIRPSPRPARLAEPGWHMPPGHPPVQHKQDPLQRLPIRQPLTTRVAKASLDLRQQRLDPPPQLVRHDPRRDSHRHPLSLTTDADGIRR